MTVAKRRPPDFTQYDGLRCWHDSNGQPHSVDDQPAITKPGGEEIYYHHGVIHRDNAPAHIHADGREEWFHHGRKLDDSEIAAILRRQRTTPLVAPRLPFTQKGR